MRYQQLGERYQLRIERGEPVAESLIRWATATGVTYASMTGIGAVSSARVSYWNSESEKYDVHDLDEQLEVVSLIGNITSKDGEPFTHIHVTLAKRDLSVVGGHFNEAYVRPTMEIWLRPEAATVQRTLDETCDLYLLNLPESL